MLTQKVYNTLKHTLLILSLSVSPTTQSDALAPDTLVVNLDSDIRQMSQKQISSILTLKQTHWDNNKRIQIYLYHKDSEAFSLLIVSQLGVFPYQLRRLWQRAGFSGRASPPIIIDDMSELITKLSETPGAVGFIPAHLITAELQRVTVTP
jgi:hypothetical protein